MVLIFQKLKGGKIKTSRIKILHNKCFVQFLKMRDYDYCLTPEEVNENKWIKKWERFIDEKVRECLGTNG